MNHGGKGDVAFFADLTGAEEIFLEIAAPKEHIAHGIRMPMERFAASLVHRAAEPPETGEIPKETAAGLLTMVERRDKPKPMLMHVLDVQKAKHDDLTRLATPTTASTNTADTSATTAHASTIMAGAISATIPAGLHTVPGKGGTDRVAADTNDTSTPDELTVWHDRLNRFSKQVVFANLTADQFQAGVKTRPAMEASDRTTLGVCIAELSVTAV